MRKDLITVAIISIFLLTGMAANAQRRNLAPENRVGLRAGFNMSDLTSAKGLDIYNGLAFYNKNLEYVGFTDTDPFKTGFNIGLTAEIKLADYWYIQPSLIFTQKGFTLNTQNKQENKQNIELNVEAYYVELPIDIVWKYDITKSFRLITQTGLFVGVGVAGESWFKDHYGEDKIPRGLHEQTSVPSVNNDYIGYDNTVHGLLYEDYDPTFLNQGTYKMEFGLDLGIGFQIRNWQITFNYQLGFIPLYNYDHDFSLRYEQAGINNISNSFDYLKRDKISSPSFHVLSVNIAYFIDLWSNRVRY